MRRSGEEIEVKQVELGSGESSVTPLVGGQIVGGAIARLWPGSCQPEGDPICPVELIQPPRDFDDTELSWAGKVMGAGPNGEQALPALSIGPRVILACLG